MFEKVVILSGHVFGSGTSGIGYVLSEWEKAGIFDYLIPFLIIFTLIYAILAKLSIFGKDKKTINMVISLAIGLMSLQFEIVPKFFSEIFPRLGVGLVVLLVMIILLGLFAPQKTWVTYTFFGAAAIILIVVLANAGTQTQTVSIGFLKDIDWQKILPWMVIAALGLIIIIPELTKKREPKQARPEDLNSIFMRGLERRANEE